ncbi:MAG: hypothetical protein P4L35_09790 [Ignavibacteriaceae bacterium]|nr:hypothetical protein [Ignavibacteriaceae bacterium]
MKYFALIFFLLLMGGCDLFQTRDAQQPDQSRSNYQLAVTPDLLIQNLINSLNDLNLQNYLSCFSDTSFSGKQFLFLPSIEAIPLFPSSPWDKKNESLYFNNLIGKIPTGLQATLVINNPSSSQVGDSLIYSASYTLNIPFFDASIPSLYEGDLKFSMVRDSRLVWTVYLWQDIKSTQYPSWSELKGRLY